MRNVAKIGFALGIGLLAPGCLIDMNVGDWVAPPVEPSSHTGSGSTAGTSGSGGTGQEVDPPTMNACVDQEQGGPTSCKDVATWKLYASQTCEGDGLLLSAYTPRETCGDGLFRYVDYTCCPKPETPPPTPTDCVDQEQGGPTSCKDVATWKLYASQTCEGAGLLLNDYATREACGDGLFRYVDYTCCPKPETPPPTPTDCVDQEQGGPTSCKDVFTWKQYASQTCEGAGLLLNDYATREACGDGLFRYVDYTCCPSSLP